MRMLAGLELDDLVRSGSGAFGVGLHPDVAPNRRPPRAPSTLTLTICTRRCRQRRPEERLRLAEIEDDGRGIGSGDLGWIGDEARNDVVRALPMVNSRS